MTQQKPLQDYFNMACAAIYLAQYASSRSRVAQTIGACPFDNLDDLIISSEETSAQFNYNGIDIIVEQEDGSYRFSAKPAEDLPYHRRIINYFHSRKIIEIWKKSMIVATSFHVYENCNQNLEEMLEKGDELTDQDPGSLEDAYVRVHNHLYSDGNEDGFYHQFDNKMRKNLRNFILGSITGGIGLTLLSNSLSLPNELRILLNMGITTCYVTASELLAYRDGDIPMTANGGLRRLIIYLPMGFVFNFTYPLGVRVADNTFSFVNNPFVKSSVQAFMSSILSLPGMAYQTLLQGINLEAEAGKPIRYLKYNACISFEEFYITQFKRGLKFAFTVSLGSKVFANLSILNGRMSEFGRLAISQTGSFLAGYFTALRLRKFKRE